MGPSEDAFRAANERIELRRRELGVDAVAPYICECDDAACTEVLRVPPGVYADVRATRSRFLVAPGHSIASGRVVAEMDGYRVVEAAAREDGPSDTGV